MQLLLQSPLPFEEDRLWIEAIQPWLSKNGIRDAALNITHYVATEMLNNVRDHSESKQVEVWAELSPSNFILHVIDTGVGLFQRLASGLGLANPREAVIEICKGKRTTDPAHHTGQGIFFSSKVCEWFSVETNGFGVKFVGSASAVLEFPNRANQVGTTIKFCVSRNPQRTLRDVFDEYCPQPEINFSRTIIGLRLMSEADGSLVSRSQGRRLMAGLDKFEDVTLDFDGVASIGQGFADEVFRVWRNDHPSIALRATHANAEVGKMLRHVGVVAS